MKIIDSFKKFFGIKEASLPEVLDAAGVGIDSDDNLYRGISQSYRDLSPLKFERALQISMYLWEKDPVAQQIILKPIEAIQNAGISFQAEDEAVQSFIDEFWDHPITGFRQQFWELWRDIKLMGEGCWPVSVNEMDGSIELGFIDPINIDRVKMVPGNARVPDKVVLKADSLGRKQEFDVIRMRNGKLQGDVFYFPINKPVNSTRGRPTLLALMDWIDLYDQAMFNDAERWALMRLFVFDLEMEGKNDEEIRDWLRKRFPDGKPPKPGTIFGHNEKVKLNAVTPDLKANDATTQAMAVLGHIAGGSGLPRWMLGFTGEVNQGVARETMRPVIWKIGAEQDQIKRILYTVFHFALEQAAKHGKHTKAGTITESTDLSFKIICNEVFPKDLVANSTAFGQAVNAITVLKDSGLVGEETARKLMVHMMNNLVDSDVTVDEIEKELTVEDEINKMFGQANGKMPEPMEKPTMNDIMLASADYTPAMLRKIRLKLSRNAKI